MYGPRATQVSRSLNALAALGWRTTVICMAPRRRGPHWPDAADPPAAPDGVVYHRVPSPEEWLTIRALWRVAPWARYFPDEKWVWIPGATRAALADARATSFDGLITFGQPWSDHVVGLRVRRATGLRWVAHFSDPWVDSPYARGLAFHRARARRLEAEVVRQADALVFVSRQTADLVMRKYPEACRSKASVVPHGYDLGDLPVVSRETPSGRPMTLVYTGRFYDGIRTPIVLFDALQRLATRTPLDGRVHVELVGPFVSTYRREAALRGLDRVIAFRDRVPPDAARRLAAAADVLLVIDAPSAGPGVFLPSKAIEYLMFRKPILGLTGANGATAELLREVDCPIADPADPAAVASAIESLLQLHESRRLEVSGEFARQASRFDIRRTTETLDGILDRAFHPREPLAPCA